MNTYNRMGSSMIELILLILAMSNSGHAIVGNIVHVDEPGCVAEIQTDSVKKWIYLKDDLKLIENSMYTYQAENGIQILWRPCSQFSVALPQYDSDNFCQDTYVARKVSNRTCDSLGQNAKFKATDGGLEVHYSLDDNSYEKATVKLICDMTVKVGYLKCTNRCLSYEPTLEFTSKYVCLREKPISVLPLISHNLSAGSLILIVVGFILLVYLIVGIIRGSIRGRSGFDRLPNSDFWQELPILVKDGCLFTFTCGGPRRTYRKRKRKNEIYELTRYDSHTPVVDL